MVKSIVINYNKSAKTGENKILVEQLKSKRLTERAKVAKK